MDRLKLSMPLARSAQTVCNGHADSTRAIVQLELELCRRVFRQRVQSLRGLRCNLVDFSIGMSRATTKWGLPIRRRLTHRSCCHVVAMRRLLKTRRLRRKKHLVAERIALIATITAASSDFAHDIFCDEFVDNRLRRTKGELHVTRRIRDGELGMSHERVRECDAVDGRAHLACNREDACTLDAETLKCVQLRITLCADVGEPRGVPLRE